MTLSEIEQRRGNADRGHVSTSYYATEFTYYFAGCERGYIFSIYNDTFQLQNEQSTLSDGTTRVGEVNDYGQRVEFTGFIGRADDLFLGMERSISVADIVRVVGVEISLDHRGDTTFWSGLNPTLERYETLFWHGEHYLITIIHDKDGVIDPSSELGVGFFSQGIW
jgi:hypothetical protein